MFLPYLWPHPSPPPPHKQGDIMTATPPADASYQRLSRLTLALLADTGWCVHA